MKQSRRKWFKRKRVLLPVTMILSCWLFGITSIDHSDYKEKEYFKRSIQALDSSLSASLMGVGEIRAGWSKENITPLEPVRIVGFGIQDEFETVHDSLYVRSVVFEQNGKRYVKITYDLLFVHPEVCDALEARLKENGIAFEGVYYGATHAHNSFGGWGHDRLLDDILVAGKKEAVFKRVIDQSFKAVEQSIASMDAIEMGYRKFDFGPFMRNRVDGLGPKDPWIHVTKIKHKNSGDSLALITYSAHATCLHGVMDENILSGDYPGLLCQMLEKRNKDFTMMFSTGGVASFSPRHNTSDIEGLEDYVNRMGTVLEQGIAYIKCSEKDSIRFASIPIQLPEPVLRVSQEKCLSPFIFNAVLGEVPASITLLQVGDVCFVGFPGEISGELYPDYFVEDKLDGKHLVVTSLNGSYTGYVVPDKYYKLNHRKEVRQMNWYGPKAGSYFRELLDSLANKL